MNPAPALHVRGVTLTPVEVPLKLPLGTSAGTVRHAALLLIELHTIEGITGNAYLFCYGRGGMKAMAALLQDAVDLVQGRAVEPLALGAMLGRRLALIGNVGVARMALSGLDIALWDARAKALAQPLAALLGAGPGRMRAYNSNGLGLHGVRDTAAQVPLLLERGFTALKLRLGYSSLKEDLDVLHAVRTQLPTGTSLMVDYNQALTLQEALLRGRRLQEQGVYWLEEPIRHDDWDGCARLARELEVPLQMGENLDGAKDVLRLIRHQACDFVMPDLARIGGVSGWVQAAAIAAAAGVELSSHLYAEVSAQLLLASESRHWLEYADWADVILQRPLVIEQGHAVVGDAPGVGLDWNAEAVARYTVQ
ncbi:MAG: enolase C-terminal domain-like protein [Burkholderiaceae bacterium]